MVTAGPVVAEQVVKVDEPRRRMASMAGSPAQLENATRDLFRMSGGQSIPVEARAPAAEIKPKVAPTAAASRQPDPPASAKKAEASVLFSLESLMKSAGGGQKAPEEEPDRPLWNMQAETPLFGTSQDQALLTTPLDPPPGSTPMDSMTVSSRRPAGMRTSLLLGLGTAAAIVLAGAGWFVLRPSTTDSPAAAHALDAPAQDRANSPSKEPATAATAPVVAPAVVGAAVVEPAGSHKPASDGTPTGEAMANGTQPDKPGGEPGTEPSRDKPAGDGKLAAATPATTAAASKPSAAPPRSTKKPVPPRATKPSAPFNVGAAKDALNAAAAKAGSCSGTSGKGKVQLTFAPSGKVSAAQLTEGPFAGTPAGKCALRHFKAASVPAFAGTPQTVAKSFKVP
ncbi:MAG: hypothetical protein RL685_2454 [Pseudomonadota bacterium]|jgi:hypothetical protein